MADMELTRRAAVGLTFAGTDITGDAAADLISLRYTDMEDGEADDLRLTFQDSDGKWLRQWLAASIDNVGLEISATITVENADGRGGSETLRTGAFELDAPGYSGPPGVVVLNGTSLDYGSSLRKTDKDKAWRGYDLRRIAAEIAGNGGLKLLYEADSNPEYERVEQLGQSDIVFLEDLCKRAGISLKVTDSTLVLFDQAAYEARPPVRTVSWGDGTYSAWDLGTGEAETAYTSCRVRYSNPLTGETYDYTYVADAEADGGDSANRLTVNHFKVSSNSEAAALAQKLVRLHNKFARTASFTVPGDPTAMAGVTWMLEDWGLWSGKYIISQAVHKVDGDGYETDVTLRACQDG